MTVTIPAEFRRAGQEEAESAGVYFSSVVTDALAPHLRGRAIDVWLAGYAAEHGAFSEDELVRIAADAGIPYVPPTSGTRV